MATATIPVANILVRFSFPKQPGDQPWSIIDVRGPVDYQSITNRPISLGGILRSPPDGGQVITAQDFGLQALDFVAAMGSQDAFYTVNLIPDFFALQNEFPSVVLQWMEATGGSEVFQGTDLSQDFVRLLAIGR